MTNDQAIRVVDTIVKQGDFKTPPGGLVDGHVMVWNAALGKFTLTAPSGITASYTHTQSIAAVQWIVYHNLGFKPNVQIVDTSDSVILADIVHLNANSLALNFSAALAGVAHCS